MYFQTPLILNTQSSNKVGDTLNKADQNYSL